MAKLYYTDALNISKDSLSIIVILNNLGVIELQEGKKDSAFYFLNKSLQISLRHDEFHYYTILNSIALFYQKEKKYELALHYYKLALIEAKKNCIINKEAKNLSDLGKLFFEINKPDSALYYIDLSNNIATKNNFLCILAENYLTLSKIEASKGNKLKTHDYFIKYTNLKDSVFNIEKVAEIYQLQRLYEVSKTNQQIEQLIAGHQIKEQTIFCHRVIQFITVIVLISVSIILYFTFLQNKKLNIAYNSLFEKNMKNNNILESVPEQKSETKANTDLEAKAETDADKEKKTEISKEVLDELMKKILIVMEDASIFCNTSFSVNKLATMLQTNHSYISQAINSATNKNFRSFLNDYRIREAKRIFLEPSAEKYTIDAISQQVGYKSSSTFRDAFKEIMGVNPYYYLKSLKEEGEEEGDK